MKKLPLGIQSFKKIINDDYVYVDKTRYVWELINGNSYYFLSRPRRFGKSLLIDTLAEVFNGDRDLFKGLYIYDTDYSFDKYPVLRLDMSNIANDNANVFRDELLIELKNRAKKEGCNIDYNTPSAVLKTFIEELYNKYKKGVVILIDEYDKPILDRIQNIDIAEANRDVLRGFYGTIKSMDPFIRFTFFTGVTKYSKTTIFSGLNNLRDITLSEKFANICGIGVDDLREYFNLHIEHLSTVKKLSRYDDLYNEILAWYDGYSWDGKTRVLNPFSLLAFITEERFTNFWYASGTPAFLLEHIKKQPSSLRVLNNAEISERVLDTFDIRKIGLTPLLFQTGYLTVDKIRYRDAAESYILKIPNHEVHEALYLNIVADFTDNDEAVTENAYWNIKEALKSGELHIVLATLKTIFASIPYQLYIAREAYYHSIFISIMNLLGFKIDAEVSVSSGRIDAVLELSDKIYIFEFKYSECAPDASQEDKKTICAKALENGINQIKNKGYADKYAAAGKDIYLAAFAFLGGADINMRYEINNRSRSVN